MADAALVAAIVAAVALRGIPADRMDSPRSRSGSWTRMGMRWGGATYRSGKLKGAGGGLPAAAGGPQPTAGLAQEFADGVV